MSLFNKLKNLFSPEEVECQCCKCQRNCSEDSMTEDMANRIIQEMWDKEERYHRSLNK